MRELFPATCNKNGITPNDNDAVTQEQLLAVLSEIQALNDRLTSTINYIDEYKEANSNGIKTITLDAQNIKASNAKISSLLEAVKANITDADFKTITVNELANIKKIVAEVIQITDNLITKNANIETASIGTATILDADISNLKAKTIEIENWLIKTFTVDTLKANVQIETPLLKAANVISDTVNTTDTITEKLKATAATINKEAIKESDITTLKTSNIVWQQYQTIVNPDEFYIQVPKFINGAYFLAAIDDTNTVCFTIEIQNSINNYYVSWSKTQPGFLSKFYIDKTDKTSQIYFKADTLGKSLTLKYASVGLENVDPPHEYDVLPINPETEYDIVYADGHKYWNPVDLFNDGTAVGTLTLLPQTWEMSSNEGINYDTVTNVQFNVYRPNQDLNKEAAVEFNNVTTEKINTKTVESPTFVTSDKDISAYDLSVFENGTLINMKDGLKVKQWRKDENELSPFVPYDENNESENRPLVYDAVNDVLKKSTGDIDIPGDLTVGENTNITGNTTISGTLEAGNTKVNGTLEAGNTKVNGTLEAGNTTIGGTLDVSGETKLTGDTFISGDLTVSGTVHSIDQEEVVADGDTVTLRANNNLPLATGQVSGIVVNKYNGTNDLAIVTDNEGTVRVGTGKGTDTTYTNIALNHSDGKYYTYENDTYTLLDPQPNGNMTSWTGKNVVDGYTHYATAVFTVIEKTSLQPLLTREEESDLTDGAVLVWDAEKTKAIGTIAPTNSMQTLVSKIVDGKISYEWGSAGSAGLAFIGTRAEYEVAKMITEGNPGHIPAKAMVIITDEDDTVKGEIK